VDQLPKKCRLKDEIFIWDITVEKGPNDNDYIVTGTIDGSSGKLSSSLLIMHSKSRFAFMLVNDGKIFDYIAFRPMGNDPSRKMRFRVEFTADPFDAIGGHCNVTYGV
jgi:hypothetical protein